MFPDYRHPEGHLGAFLLYLPLSAGYLTTSEFASVRITRACWGTRKSPCLLSIPVCSALFPDAPVVSRYPHISTGVIFPEDFLTQGKLAWDIIPCQVRSVMSHCAQTLQDVGHSQPRQCPSPHVVTGFLSFTENFQGFLSHQCLGTQCCGVNYSHLAGIQSPGLTDFKNQKSAPFHPIARVTQPHPRNFQCVLCMSV